MTVRYMNLAARDAAETARELVGSGLLRLVWSAQGRGPVWQMESPMLGFIARKPLDERARERLGIIPADTRGSRIEVRCDEGAASLVARIRAAADNIH